MPETYQAFLIWYDQLSSLYQNLIGNLIAAAIFALVVWIGKVVIGRISSSLLPSKIRKRRNINHIFRYAIHKWAITSRDARQSFDGLFFLISHSFTYFLHACILLSFYLGVSSFRDGNLFGFAVYACIAVLLREAKLWLTKPTEEQLANIDPDLKKGVLEYFHSVQYEEDNVTDDERNHHANQNL